MGRRKKEPPEFHRECIAQAAERLFIDKGISASTVAEIAQAAGYSKATVYVYFESKEEIVEYLTLRGMKMLLHRMEGALAASGDGSVKAGYLAICEGLTAFQREFPFYFELVLDEIRIDYERPGAFAIEREIFETGEQINDVIAGLLRDGIADGCLRRDIRILQTVFLFWAGISGVIRMAVNKEKYIESVMGVSVQEFLAYGFETLYRSIEA